MRKFFLIICIFLITIIVGCQQEEIIINDNSNATILIKNEENIYYDETVNNEVILDIEVENATDDKLIYLVDQVNDFVEVDNNKIKIKNTLNKKYSFTLTAVLSAKRSIYTTKDFTIHLTRGVIVGTKQISQVVVTINGDSKTQRGISWFSSSDIEDSIVYVSKTEEFTDIIKYDGQRTEFSTYAEASDKANNVPKMTFYNHKAHITGLEVNTKYFYKVGSEIQNVFSKVGSFTTASETGEVKIFLTTDVHVGANEKATTNNKFYHGALSDAINRYPDINYALNTGDLVTQWYSGYNRFESEWAYAMNISPLLREVTFIPLSGNHDNKYINSDFDNAFNNHYSLPNSSSIINDNNVKGANYSFDLNDVHIVMFNYHEDNKITNEQKQWLLNDLESSNKAWKIVFSHIELPFDVKQILEQQGVTLAFSGHEHFYKRSYPVLSTTKQEIIKDESNNLFINQVGTTYVTNSTTGGADTWKTYIGSQNDLNGFGVGSILEGLGTVETKWGMYSVLTIDENMIKVEVYVRNSTNSNTPFVLYETYGFLKK